MKRFSVLKFLETMGLPIGKRWALLRKAGRQRLRDQTRRKEGRKGK